MPNFSSAVAPPNATQATDPEPGPSRLPPPRKDSTPASNASSSELASGDRSLSSSDLSRFSYQPPQSLRDLIKKRGELEAQRIAEFGPPEPLRKSKATRPAAHRFTADFTDDDLSRVLKCVSCGDRWTVRKGATAKMRHIESCAKKHAISDEIIKRLIRAELEAPEEPKPRQKPKPSTVTNTLFEDALGDTGKTKGKRKQVQQNSTLHDPAENREAILAKARSLLKEQEIRDISQDEGLVDLLSKSDSTMDRIQMFDFGPPSATQEFGRSKLGQQTSSAMLSVLSDENPKMSTTSKLADTANTRRRFDVLTGEPIDSGSVSLISLPLKGLSIIVSPSRYKVRLTSLSGGCLSDLQVVKKGTFNLATARRRASIMTARYSIITKEMKTWFGIMTIGFSTTPCSISILMNGVNRSYGNPRNH